MKNMDRFGLLSVMSAVLLCMSCSETPFSPQTAVEDITLDRDMVCMCKGDTLKIVAEVFPGTSSAMPVRWMSSDEDVAQVTETGLVSAVGVGRAFITAGAGNEFATAIVFVRAADSIDIVREFVSLEETEKTVLEMQVWPLSASEEVVWSSMNEEIAIVSASGEVTAVAEGQSLIKATVGEFSDSCYVYVSGEPAVGNYYYSDGTSSKELFELKNVIGIVFWVGNPSSDDPALSRDFPGCTHGLVVSLVEEGGTWQGSYASFASTVGQWVTENAPDYMPPSTGYEMEDNLNKIVGYNNTKAIEAFNSDYDNIAWKVDAVKRLQFFKAEGKYPAPEGTSGWYLPSAKELTLMSVGEYEGNIFEIYTRDLPIRDILDTSLSALGNVNAFSPASYWSSSEYDANNAYVVGFHSAIVAYNIKGSINCRLRYVLAF